MSIKYECNTIIPVYAVGSRSVNYSRSESTTSFSISSYGSDMDTSEREKNVMPATSTTSGDKGMPAGFGQGLYLPQMNQPDRNKAGIGDLLSAIRQGQSQQSKSTAIAQYTAIFQQISARYNRYSIVRLFYYEYSKGLKICSY